MNQNNNQKFTEEATEDVFNIEPISDFNIESSTQTQPQSSIIHQNQKTIYPVLPQINRIQKEPINTNLNYNQQQIPPPSYYTNPVFPTIPQPNSSVVSNKEKSLNTPNLSRTIYPENSKNLPPKKNRSCCITTCIVISIVVCIVLTGVIIGIVVGLSSSKNSTTTTKILNTTTKISTTTTKINAIISDCSNYSPNLVLSNSSCKYGYSGSYCDECGLQFYAKNVKIVGGVEAVSNSWPSLVLVVFRYKFYYTSSGSVYLATRSGTCGGTLIDRSTVVTAAHCYITSVTGGGSTFSVVTNTFYPTIESMYTVYLGLHNSAGVFDGVTSLSPGFAMNITRFTIHSSYSDTTKLNDIAIIKLKNPVPLSCNLQPACLPDPSIANYPTLTDIDVWAAGWGTLSSGGSSPDKLNNVKLTLYDSYYCRFVSPSTTKNWNTQICAGEYYGGKDTCQGDSGGPLFAIDNVNNVTKYILVGITSYGVGCGDYRYPGIYTKVSGFLNWIKTNS